MKVLVTGAGRGLGYELVKEGVKRGHFLIAGCRRESKHLQRLKGQWGQQILTVRLDVTSTQDIKNAAEEIGSVVGSINGIVNNAAVLHGSKYSTADPITEADLAEFQETFDVNILGPVRIMKYFIPLLYRESGRRVILNITSEGAALRNTGHHYISYAASKAALNNYTERIRNYLKGNCRTQDIQIAMIHPGKMKTDMGVENGEILPETSAMGIWDMLEGKTRIDHEIPFYDYTGRLMPQIRLIEKEKE